MTHGNVLDGYASLDIEMDDESKRPIIELVSSGFESNVGFLIDKEIDDITLKVPQRDIKLGCELVDDDENSKIITCSPFLADYLIGTILGMMRNCPHFCKILCWCFLHQPATYFHGALRW